MSAAKGFLLTIPVKGLTTIERIGTAVDIGGTIQACLDGDMQLVPHLDQADLSVLFFADHHAADAVEACVFARERCIAFCDEQGISKGLPMNHRATVLWAQRLVQKGMASIDETGHVPMLDVLKGPIVLIVGNDALHKEL
jgi:hypothetical protein